MIIRMRYVAEGAHVKVRVFTSKTEADLGQNGTLAIGVDDWSGFVAQMKKAGCQILPERLVDHGDGHQEPRR